jgi:hypothetical protein
MSVLRKRHAIRVFTEFSPSELTPFAVVPNSV